MRRVLIGCLSLAACTVNDVAPNESGIYPDSFSTVDSTSSSVMYTVLRLVSVVASDERNAHSQTISFSKTPKGSQDQITGPVATDSTNSPKDYEGGLIVTGESTAIPETQEFGPFRVVPPLPDNNTTTSKTSIYVEGRSSFPLYISSVIAAIGILLNALVFYNSRKEKSFEHRKGVIDEFWYRTMLIPELKRYTADFVRENLDFWRQVKNGPVYSASKSKKFIEDKFDPHFHRVLMTVEIVKLIDSEFNQGDSVQQLFEEIEDIVANLSFELDELPFYERQLRIKELIDALNGLESKLMKELLIQHREFSGVELGL